MSSHSYRNEPGSHYLALFFLLFTPLFLLLLYASPARADGSFPIIAVLHAGQRPEGIAVDTSTHMVYIAYEFPSLVVGFDPIRGNVRWKAPAGASTNDVQVDSTNHHVYATGISRSGRMGYFAILDGASGKTLFSSDTAPGNDGLAFDSKRQRVYVSSSDFGTIDVFSLRTSPTGNIGALSSTLKVGSHPHALGVNSRLGRLYIGDVASNTVTVIDEDSNHILATIPVAAVPVQPIRVDEASGHVYVVCSTGQELDVIDGHTNKVTARVPVSPLPEGVAFNTATDHIYVADEGHNDADLNGTNSGTTITAIDGQSLEVLGTLQVGRAPDGVEADPALRRIYVSAEDSDAVVEISDSPGLPLKNAPNFHQAATIHQAISLLREAITITVILMLLTIVGATLGARSRRWRALEIPQNPPGGVSSHSAKHTPPA